MTDRPMIPRPQFGILALGDEDMIPAPPEPKPEIYDPHMQALIDGFISGKLVLFEPPTAPKTPLLVSVDAEKSNETPV